MEKVYLCVVSGKAIPPERVEALRELGVPETQWTTVDNSLTKKKKGIFMGEHGTSELLVVDKVYDDSVRSMFRSSGTEDDDDDCCYSPADEGAPAGDNSIEEELGKLKIVTQEQLE